MLLWKEKSGMITMGRNDLCFCGSGKKQKKCHPDVSEKSLVANLLITYNEIDNYISQQRNEKAIDFVCKKGCSACCHDYFYISEVEYYGILYYILQRKDIFNIGMVNQKAYSYIEEIKVEYPEEYSKISTHFSGNGIQEVQLFDSSLDDSSIRRTLLPCIFLDPNTCECSIYPVRPIICRLYGISKQFGGCDKVKAALRIKRTELVDINCLADLLGNNIDKFYDKRTGDEFLRRPLPIIYWFSKILSYYLSNRDTKYNYAIGRSIDDYIEYIIRLHKRQ